MTARPATLADSAFLLRLRNDAATVAAARRQQLVRVDEHAAWLMNSTVNPTRALMVVTRRGRRLGTYRLDGLGSAAVELSLTVASEWRGRGLAREVIALAVRHARRHGYAGAALIAQVRVENRSSLIAFLHNGFVPDAILKGFVLLKGGGAMAKKKPKPKPKPY